MSEQEKRCKNCTYWYPLKDGLPYEYGRGEENYIVAMWARHNWEADHIGECYKCRSRLGQHDFFSTKAQAYELATGNSAILLTFPDFGCVQFAPKNEEAEVQG